MLGVVLGLLGAVFATGVMGVAIWIVVSRRMPSRKNASGILVYHRIEPGWVWGSTWAKPRQFSKHLTHLKGLGMVPVTLERKISHPDLENEFAVGFDDALQCLHHHALPVLEEHGVPATFFVVSGFIGKSSSWDVYRQQHMNTEEIRSLLDSGHQIGSHTVTHPDLTRIPEKRVLEELEESKKSLENIFGVEVAFLSYPFGRFDSRILRIAQECGYKAAITINHALKATSRDSFAVPSYAVYVFDGLHNIAGKIRPGGLHGIEELRGKLMNRFATGTRLFGRPDTPTHAMPAA